MSPRPPWPHRAVAAPSPARRTGRFYRIDHYARRSRACKGSFGPPGCARARFPPSPGRITLRRMFSLGGKVAVVTGGGSGIGAAICDCFAHAGAFVYVVDRNPEGGHATAERIRGHGGRSQFLECDV